MKKVMMFLGVCLTAALMLVSCGKNNDPKPNPDNGKENGGETPEEETDLIVIDGDFADWNGAPKVAETFLPDGCTKVSVLALKVTSDADKIYIYFEQELEEGQAVSPFDFFLNTDGKDETGASTYLWEEAGWDYLIESELGLLASATAVRDMDDMAIYHFIGPDGEDGWADPSYQTRTDDSGFATSAGVVQNGIAKVELSVLRSVFPEMAKKIKVGILLYEGDSWTDNGVLPQGEDAAIVPMMEVTLE